MKSISMNWARLFMVTLFTMAVVSGASAQLNSNPPQTITLTATLPESLTVSLSGNAVSFTLTAGSATNAGSTTITATTALGVEFRTHRRQGLRLFRQLSFGVNQWSETLIPSSAFQDCR